MSTLGYVQGPVDQIRREVIYKQDVDGSHYCLAVLLHPNGARQETIVRKGRIQLPEKRSVGTK